MSFVAPLTIALSFAAGLGLAPPAAAQGLRTLIFEVYDADTDRRLEVDLLVDSEKLQGGQYNLKADQEAQVAIEVATLAEQSYYPRKFAIFLAGFTESRATYRIYIAKRGEAGARYSRGSVSQAAAHLTPKSVDRATVLLERIHTEAPKAGEPTQFWVNLRYTLGRAYFLNCTSRFVDSCGDAKEVFEQLQALQPAQSRLFEAERITGVLLDKIDLERNDRLNQYRRARWDLQRGRPQAALEAFEALAEQAHTDPSVARDLRVSTKQLEDAIAIARQRLQAVGVASSASGS